MAASSSAPESHPTGATTAFYAELEALGREIRGDVSEADLAHLLRIERWGRVCTALGWATAWMGPNLFSIALMSQGRAARWTIVAHHVSHNGYARVPGVPPRYTRAGFAQGWRRYLDWFDVIQPKAWNTEHNALHHIHLGEAADPDLVEANLGWLRRSGLPMPARYAVLAWTASTWKWSYYAPNTLAVDAAGPEGRRALSDPAVWDPRTAEGRALWLSSYLPYAAWHFGVAPALFLPLGPFAVASSAINSVLAEVASNLHTFVIITTNHAGEDVEAFEGPSTSPQEFAWRQIVGSVDCATGDDRTDFLHGWLNYQIEHHLWPDLTMLQYRKVQPRLRALCEKHGVPYVQESVWRRLRKTTDIMVGRTSMRRRGRSRAVAE
jgi:fatty acid desaturase